MTKKALAKRKTAKATTSRKRKAAPKPAPKRPRGRPRKVITEPVIKRPRGRPRKTEPKPKRPPGRPRKAKVIKVRKETRQLPRVATVRINSKTPPIVSFKPNPASKEKVSWELWFEITGIHTADYLTLTKADYLPPAHTDGVPITAFAALARLELARYRHNIYRDARALADNALKIEKHKEMKFKRLTNMKQYILLSDAKDATIETVRTLRELISQIPEQIDRFIPRKHAKTVRKELEALISLALDRTADQLTSELSKKDR